MKMIDCFIVKGTEDANKASIKSLEESPVVARVEVVDSIRSTADVKAIAASATAPYTLIYTGVNHLQPGYLALERLVHIANDTDAAMLYSDYYAATADGTVKNAPVIDYQEGSLRDDFEFGGMILFKTAKLREAVEQLKTDYDFAGLYSLRLALSRLGSIVHVNEYLYTDAETDTRASGKKIFDYVDPKNRAVQIEMEKACTEHLKAIGAYLAPNFEDVDLNGGEFPVEATVLIPVRNRVRTIADAIRSALSQETDFDFNVIVVDNHSTDGTTEIIAGIAAEDRRVVHIIPERKDLGIGGCWNLGANDSRCGRFAVQLDSDDVYSGPDTLAKIVKAFYDQKCGMVVGTYKLTDIDMNTIPPGIIDHKEWTDDNGRNNALRINGLGAPRAFFTPMLREIGVPNTSYGEDYALGLAFSRRHRIGRIWDVLYLCRRWEDNSDAALDRVKMNGHNLYKDRIRTWEVIARRRLNS
ncbi:MAG: glycosyltransferase [Muribaculaceae bacterium]|nr:glycosyltransferase [Muribaculaceae bacterium]